MQPVKRIEIFANYVELSKILEALEKSGVPGHSVIKDVAGKGTKGKFTNDLAMTLLDNVYVIAFFPPEKLQLVETNMRLVLNKFGGACFISDAMELETTRCVG
ncbi:MULTISPECIES: P-II family nitrogen regulator [unclassified Anabaena]|uniref:P-II family nitrogen regulator n=1 Tax=unclassified Anabaena TaxID=2619674 RepID=UPI0016827D1B|nr:P-II family nitrogen regulator [Anabaena sp. UHCC 0399]MBD2363955.1 P-II family nitrogen regulator [Anabaena minutissima FACHB-250]MEA5566583.1 P-II family nitrogen regulator [Anabaena sp. UHCC 0399]